MYIRGRNFLPWLKIPRKYSWWRHQTDSFSALLDRCEGKPPVTRGFPSQRAVTRSFDIFFEQTVEQTIKTPVILRRHCSHYDVIVMNTPAGTMLATNCRRFFKRFVGYQIIGMSHFCHAVIHIHIDYYDCFRHDIKMDIPMPSWATNSGITNVVNINAPKWFNEKLDRAKIRHLAQATYILQFVSVQRYTFASITRFKHIS